MRGCAPGKKRRILISRNTQVIRASAPQPLKGNALNAVILLVIVPQDHCQVPSLPLAAPTLAPPWALPLTSLPMRVSPGGRERSLGPVRAPYGVYKVEARNTGTPFTATTTASAAVSVGRASTVSLLPHAYAVRSAARATSSVWRVNSNARGCRQLVGQLRSVGASGCSNIRRSGLARGLEVVSRRKDGKLGRNSPHRGRW